MADITRHTAVAEKRLLSLPMYMTGDGSDKWIADSAILRWIMDSAVFQWVVQSSGIQPGVRVPPGVLEDILGGT
jgi:hypothetical protein